MPFQKLVLRLFVSFPLPLARLFSAMETTLKLSSALQNGTTSKKKKKKKSAGSCKQFTKCYLSSFPVEISLGICQMFWWN